MKLDIVIVDDAPFIREAVRSIVEKNGMRVIGEAGDGQEALEVLGRTEPDLVIMDMVLPIQNGLTVVKKILETKPHLKILACSTESQKSISLKAIEVGCRGYLLKPFDSVSLIEKIKEVYRN